MYRRRIVTLMLISLSLLLIPGALAARSVTVGNEIQVTTRGPMWEMAEAADPSNANKLAIASITGIASSPPQSQVFVSTDGGSTWSKTYATSSSKGTGDPVIVACPEQSGHAVYLFGYLDQYQYLHLVRSTNDGSTWSAIWTSPHSIDHPRMAIDSSDPNGKVGLYIAGKNEGSYNLRMWYLTGACDSTPRYTEFGKAANIDALNSIVIYDDHVVQFFYEDRPSPDGTGGNYRPYSVIKGTWSGTRPNAWLTLGSATTMFTQHNKVYNNNNGGQLDSEFVRAPGSDKLYATFVNWTNSRVAPWLELISSTNRGGTWSSPVHVDTPPSGYIADGESELMINRAGIIGVSFMRAIKRLGSMGVFPCFSYDVFFTASSDGGATWSTPSKLNSASSTPNCITFEGGSQVRWTGGDYTMGAADANGVFHPVWPDWRNGPRTPGSIYTRTVTGRAR